MVLVKKTLKLGITSVAVILTFSGSVFLSAFFANFTVNVQNVDITLGSLENSESEFTVSFAPSSGSGNEYYHIAPYSLCNQNEYDDYGNCVDPVPDLCPYLSLELKDNEDPTPTPDVFGIKATGMLNNPADLSDAWNLGIKSPCFEGECPADYDEIQNGAPLPQSQKGQTFKCNLSVETSDFPVLVKNFLEKNIAYADDGVANTLEVSAVLTGEVPVTGFSNVLFLPGLKGSRLYKNDGSENQLWEPNRNLDVETLYLNTDGTSVNADIYTRDIIKEINTPVSIGSAGQNIYKSFSNTMDQLVTDQKIYEWQAFPYDWRQSPDDVVTTPQKYENGTMLSLIPLLQVLRNSSKNEKVTIVAHSNGGLVAKALLKKLQDDKNAGINNLIDSVNVLIMIAVPEIGTASAVPAILHGYDQQILGGWLMDETRARELGRNMPGAFGLLPSKEYINHVSASPATFVDTATPSNVSTKLVQTFGSAISSYAEYKDFLFGSEGRINPIIGQTNLPISLSQSLFTKAESLHDNIDNWIPPSTMRVIEVAGWGVDTLASFEYYPQSQICPAGAATCPPYMLDQRPRFTADGDGTVVVPSAQYIGFLGSAEKYWLNLLATENAKHSGILEVDPLLTFISNIIQDDNQINPTYFSTATPIDPENRFRISVHSPVTLDAYDADGNHTGKICPPTSDFCYLEENIPNSSYLEFGEGKYINLPEDKAKSIKLQGTDIGTFTYESEKVLPNGTSSTSSFVDIPVTTQTQAEVVLNPTTQIPQLKLDVTGDGTTDFTLAPSTTFDPITYLLIMKATIDSLDLPPAKIKAFDNRVDNIIKSIQKGKIDKAKLKADRFKKVLEKRLAKPDPKKPPKVKKLSKTDAQLLLDMLNKLLDNIS